MNKLILIRGFSLITRSVKQMSRICRLSHDSIGIKTISTEFCLDDFVFQPDENISNQLELFFIQKLKLFSDNFRAILVPFLFDLSCKLDEDICDNNNQPFFNRFFTNNQNNNNLSNKYKQQLNNYQFCDTQKVIEFKDELKSLKIYQIICNIINQNPQIIDEYKVICLIKDFLPSLYVEILTLLFFLLPVQNYQLNLQNNQNLMKEVLQLTNKSQISQLDHTQRYLEELKSFFSIQNDQCKWKYQQDHKIHIF